MDPNLQKQLTALVSLIVICATIVMVTWILTS
jgi:hypothetical protein